MKLTKEYVAMWGSLIIANIKIETGYFWFWFLFAVFCCIIDIINQFKK